MAKEADPAGDSATSDLTPTYEIPIWAARPPEGSHLDVMKGEQLIQKLMVDEKRAYFFGRNPKLCDFVVEHASCSRVHAILLYHKFLKRFALVDLNSCHGTFVGNSRLDALQPIFIEVSDVFHFGASTRRYILRGRLEGAGDDDETGGDVLSQERELENLTEYNTALNRRVPIIPISLEDTRRKSRKQESVSFVEEETIINPEDVDPTVGRFRNLVATAIISSKPKGATAEEDAATAKQGPPQKKIIRPGRVDDYNSAARSPMLSSLSIVMNAAPDLELYARNLPVPTSGHVAPFAHVVHHSNADDAGEPAKKKYAKESWPGRKPSQGGVLS